VVDPTPTGDTTPPVVTVPSNISVSTPSSSGITSTFTASASDNVSGSLSTSCNPLSGSLFPIGTTTVTCTAIDNSGNLGNASFTVTVTYSTALPTVVASFDGEDDASSDYFTPNELIVNVGDTVTWLYDPNSYYNYHRIYGEFTGDPDHIGEDYPPYEHTFDQPGTYEYTDHVKGWCQNLSDLDPATCPIGTITVVDADTAAASTIVIPSWIKNNAGWWASDQITDSDFVSGLQWLISNGIMSIPPTEQGVASDNVIPSWIKNNAEWWADGLIDNFAFVTGLQWLITNGIMVIG